MKVTTFTYDDIMKHQPCYDPANTGVISKAFNGSAADLLRAGVSIKDIRWLSERIGGIVSDITFRRFAALCAANALNALPIDKVDARSWAAVEAAMKYSLGLITIEQLIAVRNTALAAARAARAANAANAAVDAAPAADAANAAVDAANAAYAAYAAARAADAAHAAHAAYDARAKTEKAQREMLADMIEGKADFTLDDLYNNY